MNVMSFESVGGTSMRTAFIFLLLTSTLAGCETIMTPDPYTQAQREREKARQREYYFADLRGQCHTYGFQSGTPELASCVQRLDSEKRQARQLRGHCNLLRGAALGEPTKSGSGGESFAKANKVYNECMAGT